MDFGGSSVPLRKIMGAAELPGFPVAGAQFSEDVSEDTLSIATFISVFYN